MLFFDPLTASALFTLATAPGHTCKPPKAPRIVVKPTTDKLEYDYKRSLLDIQTVDVGDMDPYSLHGGISITQGFAEGQITVSEDSGVKTKHEFNPRTGLGCVWYDTIEFYIDIDPKITIAREIKRDRCMHKAVLEHEHKHVMVDRGVINDYTKIIAKRLVSELKKDGWAQGPFDENQIREAQTDMQYKVIDIVQDEMLKMSRERNKRQFNVDTREEYDRVSALCPDFQKKKDKLYKKVVKKIQKQQGQ